MLYTITDYKVYTLHIYIYNLTVHKKPIHVYITLIKAYIAKDEMHWELGDKNLYKLV